MKTLSFLIASIIGSTFALRQFTPDELKELHPDTGLDTLQLIEKYGFPVERHPVVTEDGYIVEMHRIPHGRNNKDSKEVRAPVMIMHGLMSSSADFVNFGEKSLAFLLADLGYDVWLGNARGNYWSRNHTTLDPDVDREAFWSYSWHEIGVYDLPACIDHILATNGEEKLFYIGHSQGGTAFFVLNAMRPEYNDKIRLFSGLAPAAFLVNIKNIFLRFLSIILDDVEQLAHYLGIWEFLPHSELNHILGEHICIEETGLQDLCANLLLLVMGYDSEQLNNTMISVIITNAPSGSSSKQYIHYGQGIKDEDFRQYNYGDEKNMEIYGQLEPPSYDLSKITAPAAIYYGANDVLVAVEDAQLLISKLGNVVRDHLVDYPKFNHIDFLWANDIMPLLYDHVLDLMSQY